MTSNEREDIQNFRSNYYQRLSSTTALGVEEKKSLRKLLSMTPLDMRKLEQFCQHLHVPNDFRLDLWKILLKISPMYKSTNEYVANQRLEHFTELAGVVEAMRIVPSDHPSYDTYKLVVMYLIEERTYMLNFDTLCQLPEASLCHDIVNVVCRMDLSACDTYWISRNFTSLVRKRIHPEIACLVDKTYQSIQREDIEGKLCEHLVRVGAYDKIPFADWFYNCFSKVFPEITYARVWDKVISGSTAVLVYIAVALLLINRRPILFMKTVPDILSIFNKVMVDTADEVVRRGIELWQRNGGKLTPSSARASPAVMCDRSPTPTLLHSSN